MAAHHLLVTTHGMTGYETDALIAAISEVIPTDRATVEWLTQETLPPGTLPTLEHTNQFSAAAEEDARLLRKFNDDEESA